MTSSSKDKEFNTISVLIYFFSQACRYSKQYLAFAFVSIILRSCAPFINIIFPKLIIGQLLTDQDIGMIAIYIATIGCGNFFFKISGDYVDSILDKHQNRLEKEFDRMIGDKSMTMDFEYTETAEILSQSEKASTGMSWFSGGISGITNNVVTVFSNIITLAGVTFILTMLSPLAIALLVIIVLFNLMISAKIKKIQVTALKKLVVIGRKFGYYGNLNMDLSIGKDVRLYGSQSLIEGRARKFNDEGKEGDQALNGPVRKFTSISTLASFIQQSGLYIYLAHRVIVGILKVDDYVMLVTAAETFTSCLHGIIEQVLDIRKNADFMSEYKRFMEYPAVKVLKNTPVSLTKDHIIEFKNVSFKYPRSDQLVLNDLSLTINSGERLSIVGLNGAGKTTFIKLLCRLYDPTEGEILLNGLNIKELDYDQYLGIFSVVFQDFHLLHLTVRENVALGQSGQEDEKIFDSLDKAGLQYKINSISRGLDTAVFKDFDKEGIEFSGGESQKLAIARAIYKSAPIVILDEPTAALDPVAEYEIFSRFNNLIGDKTTIYISHRLSSTRFCDVIAVFDDGRLVQYGTHEELARHDEGLYGRMWQAQAQYYV